MRRRRLVFVVAALMTLAGAAGCSQSSSQSSQASSSNHENTSAKKPGSALYVGFYGGSLGKEFETTFVKPFESKYNVKVNVVTADDSVRYTQLAQNPSHPNLDVAFFMAPTMPKVVSAGIADTLNRSKIPNLNDVYPSLVWQGNKAVAFSFGAWGIIYNSSKVTQPITSWADLLTTAFTNKVTAPALQVSSSILTLSALAKLNGGSLKNPGPGFSNMEWLANRSLSLWKSPATLIKWLKQGEVWLSPYTNADTYALKDPNLKFAMPKEGGYLVPFYVVKVHNDGNPAGAQMFINYILGKKVQENWVTASYYSPANKQTPIPPSYDPFIITGNGVKQLIQIDWSYYNQHQAQIAQKWHTLVGGGVEQTFSP